MIKSVIKLEENDCKTTILGKGFKDITNTPTLLFTVIIKWELTVGRRTYNRLPRRGLDLRYKTPQSVTF